MATSRARSALTAEERRCAHYKFIDSLYCLAHCEIFWVPSSRAITARSVGATCKPHRLPIGAVLIGTYTHPFKAKDFLGDLDDVLEKIRAQRSCLQRA